jgi:hypothetical protein
MAMTADMVTIGMTGATGTSPPRFIREPAHPS